MSSILEAEGSTNELFQSPGPTSAQFLLDCLRMLEGSNLTEKVRALFQKIQEYYKAENVDSKLPTLTLMIREKASQSPKLRAKAAEARGLILFAYRMCETHMDNNCVLEHAIKMAYLELWECYCCLSKDKFQATKLQSHARRFFTFVQRIRKYRRENVADQTKAPQFFGDGTAGKQPCRCLDISR